MLLVNYVVWSEGRYNFVGYRLYIQGPEITLKAWHSFDRNRWDFVIECHLYSFLVSLIPGDTYWMQRIALNIILNIHNSIICVPSFTSKHHFEALNFLAQILIIWSNCFGRYLHKYNQPSKQALVYNFAGNKVDLSCKGCKSSRIAECKVQ